MLASSDRMVPAIAMENRDPDRALTCSEFSSWVSSTSEFSSMLNVPLLPLRVTVVPLWLNSTPFGSSTGSFAILDIVVSRFVWQEIYALRNYAENLTTYTLLTGLAISCLFIFLTHGKLGAVTVTMPQAIILGPIFSLAGMLGDLAESLLKRSANIKDSGAIFPGMGGLLDIFDSLLFAVPVGYICLRLLPFVS